MATEHDHGTYERNRDILRMRGEGKSLRCIGNKHNLSPERVRQILSRLDDMFSEKIEQTP